MGTLGDMLVLVDFQGDQDDELLLKTGDVVKNVKKTVEEGWLEGELNGKKGLFPQLFVKEIPSNFKNDNDQRYPRSIRRTQAPLQTKKQRLCKAEYSYTPLKADELELVAGEIFEVIEEIEDGWWLGKKGEVVGAFPSNFVQEITEPPTDKVPDLKKNNKQRPKMADINFAPKDVEKAQENKPVVKNQNKDQAPLPPIIKEFCRVMFDYEPSSPDELTMKKGDMVLILSKETEDEGWWKGEINGRSGLFPDNFVILLPPKSNIKTKKLPTRRSAIKAPVAKAEVTTMDKKVAEVSRPESPASKGQKVAKAEVTTMDKKVAEVSRPESPASKGQKDQKDAKNNSTPKVTNQPAKKSTPPPPVPKSKPNPVPTAKPSSETPTKPVEDTTVKSKDSNPTLDGLRVSSVKLAHPTADRPKMPGKRLPKNKTGLPENVISLPEPVLKKNEEQVNSHCKSPTSAKASPKFSTSPNQVPVPTTTKTITRTPSTNSTPKRSPEPTEDHVTPSQTLQIEELMAEIKALKLMMEMLKNNHTKDIENLRGEINEERTKRTALQSEIESLKKMTSS